MFVNNSKLVFSLIKNNFDRKKFPNYLFCKFYSVENEDKVIIIEKLKKIRHSEDHTYIKNYIFNILNLNNNYDLSNERDLIFSDNKSEHQFKGLIEKHKNIFQLREKIRIFEFFVKSNKLHTGLCIDLLQKIIISNEKQEITIDIFLEILNLIKKCNLLAIENNIMNNLVDELFLVVDNNFEKYKLLYNNDKIKFFEFFNSLMTIHYLTLKPKEINFGKTTELLDKICKFYHNIMYMLP